MQWLINLGLWPFCLSLSLSPFEFGNEMCCTSQPRRIDEIYWRKIDKLSALWFLLDVFFSLYALPINIKYFTNRHWELRIVAWWHVQATTSFSMHTIILANIECSCLLCSIFFLLICEFDIILSLVHVSTGSNLFTSTFINSKLYICGCVCCVLHLYLELHNFPMQQKENTVQNVKTIGIVNVQCLTITSVIWFLR